MDGRERHMDPRCMDERHGDRRYMDGISLDLEVGPGNEPLMGERNREGRQTEGRPMEEERLIEAGDMEWQYMEGRGRYREGTPGMPGLHLHDHGERKIHEAYHMEQVYNIIPVQGTSGSHPAAQFPEVRAAMAALKVVGGLRAPVGGFEKGMDILDWLGFNFGFQEDNIKNQREHIVLLLANAQMRLDPPPDPIDTLKLDVRKLRKKVTKNYLSWCRFLHIPSSIGKLEGRYHEVNEQKELLFAALYFLIWGEAANLRFMPECLCFLFHNMAAELNRILDQSIDSDGRPVRAVTEGSFGFLEKAIKPIYDVVKAESEASRTGAAPHAAWRNYDDMNEYFWSKRCLTQLCWPMSMSCNYLVAPKGKGRITKQKVGKTGFVERRSFWNVFRSFDRVWVALILALQLIIIVAFKARASEGSDRMPWTVLSHRDAQAQALSIFITWAGLRTLQALLDFGMQFSLVTMRTLMVGVRMALKFIVASVWVVLFSVYYSRMWSRRNADGRWTSAALQPLHVYLGLAFVFITPEVLALLLFIIPFVRNSVESSNWWVFRRVTWWFQSTIFVGRGLREGFFDNLKYTLFWLAVLLLKVSFSYFLQILPLVRPTRTSLDNQDGTINYKWHEFFNSATRTALLCTWAPVILIYFMDLQIWYALVSALVGGFVGLLGHLGEIRNTEQMRSRFQFFPSAVVFNLIPEEGSLKQRRFYNWWGRVKDAVSRIKLRFGIMQEKKSSGARNIEIGKFKHIWNEVITTFREEDIIGDYEVGLLKMPDVGWNISVTQWPLRLLSNEIRIALRYCDPENYRWYHSDRWLWTKISNNEYRRCAVIETYESLKHILSRIIREDNDDRHIFSVIVKEIDSAIQQRRFTKTFKLKSLPRVHECLIKFIGVLMKRPRPMDTAKVTGALQTLYEVLVRDFPKDDNTKVKLHELASSELLFVNAVELPEENDHNFYAQLTRLHTALSTTVSTLNVPRSLEARRRLSFFSNSIFMTMPRAPQVEKMLAFSVLTPYYSEDVMYNTSQLNRKNEDGVSTLYYLKKIFPEDWEYFKERMAKLGLEKEDDIWKHDGGLHIRLWASYRGQTLVRTVRGMMYYGRALQKLAFLEHASELDVEGHKELVSRNDSEEIVRTGTGSGSRHSSLGVSRSRGASDTELYTGHHKDQDRATAAMKFTYVVSCQKYGSQKAGKEQAAADVLYLMKTYEALRVAYFDQTGGDGEPKRYYSVLVKYDPDLQQEVEIFRIQLPGPLILGEGKPENQNHALIFTRGDAIQTIDMNQENYYEEALKMRNLLQEFNRKHGIRKPTILGVREHVFTGAVSSLASFMSAQEMSFVTLGQRVLANPLKVRMHYGHPDVFDRLWFLTRGGISKASKVINISEDIYAGFNCTLRGGTVTHHEYIQVGKGRDVGLNQIAMFEAKVASGNGEQMLSRDIYRLGHRLDFFRMLSVYYTTVGFFVNNVIVVLTVYAFLWGRCYLAVSGIEESISVSGSVIGNDTLNAALSAALNQQFLVQIGIVTALPMIVQNALEKGFLEAIWEFLTMQLQLTSVFFTFSMGTRAHFFGRTILHGGASYRATGRGFVIRHETFTTNYQLYARSHFVKGIEIILLLIVYLAYGSSKSALDYLLMTYSSWFLGITWILAPFLFNPSGFDWLKCVEDYDGFTSWIWHEGGVFVKGTDSWLKWWDEQQDHFRSTGFWGKLMEIVLDLRFFFFQYGIVYRLKIANGSTSILVYLLSWTYILVAGVVHLVLATAADRYGAKRQLRFRGIQAAVSLLMLLAIVMLFEFTELSIGDIFTSMLAFIPTGWGMLSIALVLRPFLEKTRVWPLVIEVARLYEFGMGLFVMVPVALLSWLPGFQAMQTRILFNEAFSRGLQIQKLWEQRK